MRPTTSLPSVLLAFLLMASAGFPSLSPVPASPRLQLMAITELKAGAMGHYVVTATINHTDVQVMVDTGASVVALSQEDADRAGLHPGNLDYTIPVSTANGAVNAARVKLERVAIDAVRVDDVDALVLPKGALQGTLLGMSFLAKLSSFKSEDGILTLRN